VLSIAGWLVAALVLVGAAVTKLRNRHRAEEDDEPDDEDGTAADEKSTAKLKADEADDKEPVAAGSGKWSFKG
jgi:hypothetical protein